MSGDLKHILEALAGRFEILEQLGRGGMGVVYRARHRGLDREVALKIALVSVPEAAARFRTEAQALARLDHPAIVPLYEADLTGDTPYFVMPVVKGRPLTDLISNGPLAPARAIALAAQVAAGLAHAHQHGIVHRDVKPDNILVSTEGDARLADFGIARWTSGRPDGIPATAPGTVLGSPAYMAPEQIRGNGIGPATDVYGLGATFYEMLTGRAPFAQEDLMALLQAHLKETPVPPSKVAPGISRELDALVLLLLEKDPAKRPAHGGAVVAALAALAPRERAAPVRPMVATQKVSPAQPSRGWSALVPMLAFAGGAIVTSIYRQAGLPAASSRPVSSPAATGTSLADRARARVERLVPLLAEAITTSVASSPSGTSPILFEPVIPPPPPEGYRLELALRSPARGVAAVLHGPFPKPRELVGREVDGFTVFDLTVQPRAGRNHYRWELVHPAARRPEVDHIRFRPLGLPPPPPTEEAPVPEAELARATLGESQHRRGQLALAVETLDACVKARPAAAWPWSDLGATLFDQGRAFEARAIALHTLRLDPGRMWFWIHLADAEARLGHREAAVDHARFAVECEPRNADGPRELARIAAVSPGHR